ncbi:hypothetical protein IFM47457_07671 [Aspergillus lentulus]|nr:hypothetical protein IFM47457_07671 [Aspergillus lentulus]
MADQRNIIKERSSETTKVMNMVNALYRTRLTDTTIQNKYEELRTLLNWMSPRSRRMQALRPMAEDRARQTDNAYAERQGFEGFLDDLSHRQNSYHPRRPVN